MRGVKDHPHGAAAHAGEVSAPAGPLPVAATASDAELAGILREIATEVRSLRESVEQQASTHSGGQRHV
jgi:hypothetical protein